MKTLISYISHSGNRTISQSTNLTHFKDLNCLFTYYADMYSTCYGGKYLKQEDNQPRGTQNTRVEYRSL